MSLNYLRAKKGKPVFGIAIRNPDTYEEGEYRVYLFNTRGRRDKEAVRKEEYMPQVKRFDIDIAKVADLT